MPFVNKKPTYQYTFRDRDRCDKCLSLCYIAMLQLLLIMTSVRVALIFIDEGIITAIGIALGFYCLFGALVAAIVIEVFTDSDGERVWVSNDEEDVEQGTAAPVAAATADSSGEGSYAYDAPPPTQPSL